MNKPKNVDRDSVASHCSSSPWWGVTVSMNGEDILTISDSHIYGKDPMSDLELATIRQIAESLKGFASCANIDFGDCPSY